MNTTSHNAMAVHMASCDPAQGRQAIMPAPGGKSYRNAVEAFRAPSLPPVGSIDTSSDEREVIVSKEGSFVSKWMQELSPEMILEYQDSIARDPWTREMICTPVYDDWDARRDARKTRAREQLGIDGGRLFISFDEFDSVKAPSLEELEALRWKPVPGFDQVESRAYRDAEWVDLTPVGSQVRRVARGQYAAPNLDREPSFGDVEYQGERVSRAEARRRGWLD